MSGPFSSHAGHLVKDVLVRFAGAFEHFETMIGCFDDVKSCSLAKFLDRRLQQIELTEP